MKFARCPSRFCQKIVCAQYSEGNRFCQEKAENHAKILGVTGFVLKRTMMSASSKQSVYNH